MQTASVRRMAPVRHDRAERSCVACHAIPGVLQACRPSV
jgi:hypothetical protein